MLANLTIGSAFQTIHNGEPRWIAQSSYTDEDGKRRFIRGVGITERQALQRRQENIARRLNAPTRVSPTVRQLLTRWIDSFGPADLSSEVKRKYERQIEMHVIPYIGSTQLVDLDRERLQRLFSHELADLADGAHRNTFKNFRAMLNWAVKNQIMPMNPVLSIKPREYVSTVHNDDVKLIDKRTNVAIQILDWLEQPDCPYHDDYNRVLFSFLGLRRAELLGMTWDRQCITGLNRKGTAKLHVQQQLMRAKGKGWFIEPKTKTGKTRTIPLPEKWRLALLDERAKDRHTTAEWSAQLVWKHPNNRVMNYNDYDERWRLILSAYWNRHNDVPKPLTADQYWRPHANRHLTASIMFRAGETLEYVQDILGHSDEVMTLWYTHFSEDAKRTMMESYEQALNKTSWNELRRKKRA